jgi:tRNA threonylcarbamoyladenosine biosynthesis protein TsaB
VVDESRVLAEMTTNMQKNHSVRLMDCISLLLDETETAPEQLAGIAVAKGPGSYTGVRIGVATAKSMAWSLNIPVVGVSSLQAVAMNALGFSGGIIPLFDARRGQVYTGYYDTEGMRTVSPRLSERIILLREWLPLVSGEAEGRPLLFLGDDVALHRETIVQTLGERAQFAPASFNHPRAAHIGFLALSGIREGGNAHQLTPEYLQVAEAEAKWLAKTQEAARPEE